MKRFVEEADRGQWTLLPECLDDFIGESNPVRVIDAFVDVLDLAEMGFQGGAGGDWSTCTVSYRPIRFSYHRGGIVSDKAVRSFAVATGPIRDSDL